MLLNTRNQFLLSVGITTDNPPPSDKIPKIEGGVICSEFEKIQGGTLTKFFQNFSHLKKKKQGGTLTKFFQNFSHLKKKVRGDPYYQFSKF